MKISIIKGNEKIPLLTQVTKSRTECCAEKKCDRCRFQEGCFRESAARISKFCGGGGGHERSVKHYFPGNTVFHIINERFNNLRK